MNQELTSLLKLNFSKRITVFSPCKRHHYNTQFYIVMADDFPFGRTLNNFGYNHFLQRYLTISVAQSRSCSN